MDIEALGPRRAGCEYFDGGTRKHYIVLAIGELDVTVRWQNGQVATIRAAWEPGLDLITRPADRAPFGREYSADGENWHFAPPVARSLSAVPHHARYAPQPA